MTEANRTEDQRIADAKSNGVYPVYPGQPLNGSGEPMAEYYYGISKRELFAAMAMQGMRADHSATGMPEEIAKESVRLADALLKELEK